jgi:two-component system chemotaxis sensor kinase CheA
MDEAEFMQKLQEAFDAEASQHLQSMSEGLLAIEQTQDPMRKRKLVDSIFRESHSLKGAARSVSRSDIETLSQALESLFSQWKHQEVSMAPAAFETVRRAIDFIGGLGKLAAAPSSGSKAVQDMVRVIKNLGSSGTPPC